MALTDIIIRNSKARDKQYKLSDGKGLHLLVHCNGSKYWVFRYRFAGKEKMLSLGVYPETGLKEARGKLLEIRKQVREGIDPSQAKKEAKHAHLASTENSFEKIAREWHANQKSSWTERHSNYVLRRLEADVFPVLGSRAINVISPPELLAVLRSIEARGAIDIAHRELQTS